MKIKELIQTLKKLDQNMEVVDIKIKIDYTKDKWEKIISEGSAWDNVRNNLYNGRR